MRITTEGIICLQHLINDDAESPLFIDCFIHPLEVLEPYLTVSGKCHGLHALLPVPFCHDRVKGIVFLLCESNGVESGTDYHTTRIALRRATRVWFVLF